MPQPEVPNMVIIYWAVGCPACDAPPLKPCSEDDQMFMEDVHLARATLFASARLMYPRMRLNELAHVVDGDQHPGDDSD